MAEIIGLARGALDPGAMLLERGRRLAARLPQRFDGSRVLLQSRERIEQTAMGRRVHQRAFVVLAVDLDQRGAHGLQRLHADRLVVDEGAGAAVGQLHAAQDHLAGVVEAVFDQQFCRRVRLRHVEDRGHLPLLHALAHEAGVAAAAKRQRKSIEQDGFAGTGLAGQHREPAREIDVEPFDQHDVADRKTCKHEWEALAEA